MAFIGLFITLFIPIILAILVVAFVKKFFFQNKPDTPSKLAKIIGPFLIIVSIAEWLSLISFPLILASFKLSSKDIQDVLIALIVCFFSGICGFSLSLDYYQRYYKIPKYKKNHSDNEPQIKSTNFIPHHFN